MATISRGTKASGGTAFTDGTTAYGSEVETDFNTVYTAWNNHDAGTSIWTVVKSSLFLAAAGSASVPTYSFTGDTNTGWYNSIADEIAVTLGGTAYIGFSSLGITLLGATSLLTNSSSSNIGSTTTPFARIFMGSGSAASPSFTFQTDTGQNTGMFLDSQNGIGFSGGGTEIGAFTAAPSSGQASLWVYDGTVSGLRQITFGANDSGGAGFKYLRISNS